MSSILADYFVRSAGTGHIFNDLVRSLPFVGDQDAMKRIGRLFLRLNCLTSAYAPLWEEITGEPWTLEVPIRNAWDRQQAQIEIDALVALSLGVSAEELCMIYRTQFPVMRRYDQDDPFDVYGRLVPKPIAKAEAAAKSAESLSQEARTWMHPQSEAVYVFEYPFRHLYREQEIKEAFLRVQS